MKNRHIALIGLVFAVLLGYLFIGSAWRETSTVLPRNTGAPIQGTSVKVGRPDATTTSEPLIADPDKPTAIDQAGWSALVADLSPAQQKSVREFAHRYPEAYAIGSKAQFDWMANRGYLLPKEIADASVIPLEDLERRAQQGDIKAAMLAMDRLINESTDGGEYLGENTRLLARISKLQRVQRRGSCSPFSYYLEARYYEELARRQQSIDTSRLVIAVASLGVVNSLGDSRSRYYGERLSQAMQMDGRLAMELATASANMRISIPAHCPTDRIPR